MANERQWDAVPPVLLIADGTINGPLKISDTAGFYYGMQATLKNTSSQITVYIKNVVDKNTVWVSASKGAPDYNIDLSPFTEASGTTLSAAAQNKSSVPMEARLQATYVTDPVDAWRVVPIDSYGNHYTNENPLPVAFDGTVSIGDVSIVEGGNTMVVNPDGSINVIVESQPSPNSTVVNTYNELTNVASGATVQIVSYTIPSGKQGIFQKASFSGENVARYDLFINGVAQDTARTMFGGDLTGEFNFETGNDSGLVLTAGTTIYIQVYNNRPSMADFEARIQVLLLPA